MNNVIERLLNYERCQFADVSVQAITQAELTEFCLSQINAGRISLIANHNLHSIYLVREKKKMKMFYDQAVITHADGMAAAMLFKLLNPAIGRAHRTTYVDWFPELLTVFDRLEARMAYVGGIPKTVSIAAEKLSSQYPGIRAHFQHGYFDKETNGEENKRVICELRQFRPQVVFLGMGMPVQEEWFVDNLNDLPPAVYFQAGAALDYWSGVVHTPPRWMGRTGTEWLYRLCCEPRRLWKRYLWEPIKLIPYVSGAIVNGWMKRRL